MKTHELKTWPVYFDAVWMGDKKFEARLNDRGFNPGDRLILKEYDPESNTYSGRHITAYVSYRLPGGRCGIASDYCVMSLMNIRKHNGHLQ